MLYMPQKKATCIGSCLAPEPTFVRPATKKNLVNTHRQLSIDHQDGTEVARIIKRIVRFTRLVRIGHLGCCE